VFRVLKNGMRNGRSIESRRNAVWAATRINSKYARDAVRSALGDADESVRQAAAHSVALWRDQLALSGLLDLLRHDSTQNKRAAAEALGRVAGLDQIMYQAALPALLSALARNTDPVLDHSLTYALIETNDAKSTTVGLKDASPRIRRAALIALDQM